MDNWNDRDNWFIDKDDNYDDSWLKPNVEAWRSIHPLGYNPYEYGANGTPITTRILDTGPRRI